jgi:ADP-ribosyltransferase exoenzyme
MIDSFKKFLQKPELSFPEPIHFKGTHQGTKPSNAQELIHFRMESASSNHLSTWLDKNDNNHLGSSSEEISHHLKSKQKPLTQRETRATKKYTDYSSTVNHDLIAHHDNGTNPLEGKHADHVKKLDSTTNRTLENHLSVYSGVKRNPGKLAAGSKNRVVHLPAFTSTTHDKATAQRFAVSKAKGNKTNEHHIIHFHLRPGDQAAHVSHVARYDDEHETVLPRNTKIIIHPKPDVYHHGNDKYHVWHAQTAK